MALLIGVTGGISSGKTSVVKCFKGKNTVIINADKIGHHILHKKIVQKKIRTLWGQKILIKNKISRNKIGNIVFSDSKALKSYNKLIHPYLLRELKNIITQYISKPSIHYIVVDAALIIEWNLQNIFEVLIIVDSFMANRLNRLTNKSGLTSKDGLKRIKSQLPISKKKKYAQYVINNNGSLAELEEKSQKLFTKIKRGPPFK